MSLKVTKLKNNRMFQNVVEQIEEAIVSGDLPPGESLPPEMKLKEMFDTSRSTIREALRVLEEKGLIAVKVGVGGGAVVRTPDAAKMAENLDMLLRMGSIGFDHLAEFREAVEGLVTSLAAKRITKEGANRLRDILRRAGEALENNDRESFLKEDIQVHIAIAEIADNPMFIAVLRMVHENILGSFDHYTLSDNDTLDENHRDLEALVETIIAGRAGVAGELAREHVRKFNNAMKAQNARRMKESNIQ